MVEPVRFSDLAIHASLQPALAARGYDTATPVQAAVLDAAAAGRDLVVSSQTGSGKTIAFGAALAGTLLEAAPQVTTPGKPAARNTGAPRALVVVPTRELVAQVREELGWLLAGTPLRLASFTGGTAVSGDLRALHRGVDVAIGTPGRLVDLMRREKLSLGQIEVVVLDEADEMLDLGFREDLETLLGAAPVERRTLLLSATLPPEIRALARRFQRDALAVDPRKGGQDAGASGRAGPGAHDDITYVAHLIAGGDRLPAVVNLLRASEDTRAIVFCTTRDGVGSLHRALLARGFAATAISGERAQAERDRALEQVREGEAQILVATNVAARGLHLPDVDLIIHADLPLNAESLTHRSGRTGRAGRKGTAVVIASLAERRKAERLLAAAQVRVEWTAPPSEKEIAAAGRARLLASLLAESAADGASDEDGDGVDGVDVDVTAGVDAGADAADVALAGADDPDDLLAPFRGKLSSDDLARRLLARELERLPTGETLLPVHLPSAGSDRRFGPEGGESSARRRSPGEIAREGVMFRVNLGGKDQADPRWLLPLICRRGGVTRREVGAIRIGPQETLFEIAGDAARDFALAASQSDPRAPHVRMEAVDGRFADQTGPAPGGPAPRDRPFHASPRPAPRAEGPRGKPFGGSPRPAPPAEGPRAKPFGGPRTAAPPAEGPRAKPFGGPPPVAEGPRAQPFAVPPLAPPPAPLAANGSVSPLPAHDRPFQRQSFRDRQPSADGPPSRRPKAPPVPVSYAKTHLATARHARPHAAKTASATTNHVKPYPAKPYAAPGSAAKSHHAKPHHAKPHGSRTDQPRHPGGKRKG